MDGRDPANQAVFLSRYYTGLRQIAEFALQQFARVYDIEREVKELSIEQRHTVRQQQNRLILDALHEWMTLQRRQVPDGSADLPPASRTKLKLVKSVKARQRR